jgi:hypothetical protein
MKHIETPPELMTPINHSMLMFMLNPKFAIKLQAQKKFLNSLSEQHMATLRLCGYEIFKENNCVQRNSFFS